MVRSRLSEKSRKILQLVADGCSYNQIVDGGIGAKYGDIFEAAREALRIDSEAEISGNRMDGAKSEHAKAYERWTPDHDRELASLYQAGSSIGDIATRLERQPSAIKSRLGKLGLAPIVYAKEV
ncbi:hypothetical protein GJ654_12490 [Rhodoblastus acidophilus]|uniref:Uncharacterized protein n=1 Tax=Rhodoblastus acidophilus TaxID=1074 RepID=A0A6N8DSJ1_RHOAC|nr:hypothetical protein [Rhodoblastus acidophilus]MCW2275303.1 DNA-binding NarL/FixJ family response regulator [Rhodoblastus acidophilus]MTV31804.1 hypothetical protein [Rhodoblastus acidophilus]